MFTCAILSPNPVFITETGGPRVPLGPLEARMNINVWMDVINVGIHQRFLKSDERAEPLVSPSRG